MKRKASDFEEVTSWSQWSPSSEISSASDDSPNRLLDTATPWARISKQYSAGDNHLNVRTRKRVRDNRPALELIHRNTLAKLFEAQRQPHPTMPLTGDGKTEPQMITSQVPAQRNLHSFFSIPQSHVLVTEPRVTEQLTSACEDCGNSLVAISGINASDIDMMDVSDQEGIFACASCHRNVCDTCSVRADHRLCLECALPGNG